MFTANPETDRLEGDPPSRRTSRSEDDPPAPRSGRSLGRSEGFTDRRDASASARRETDRDDEDRPRRRRYQDDEYDDRRRRPRRYDEYDEDEYDDYDDRRPRQERKAWRGVRTGLNLAVIAGWLQIAMVGVVIIGGGMMLLLVGGLAFSAAQGAAAGRPNNAAAGAAAGMLGGACLFLAVVGLLGLAEVVLRLLGYGICMQVPSRRGSPARGLCIAAFSCACAATLLNLVGGFMGGFGSGFSNAGGSTAVAMAAMGFGNFFGWISNLCTLAGWVLWIFFLRCICQDLRNKEVAGRVLTVFIAQMAFGVVATILVVMMLFVIGFTAFSVGQANSGASAARAIGGGMIAFMVLMGVVFLGWIGLYIWYVLTMQSVREVVDRYLARS